MIELIEQFNIFAKYTFRLLIQRTVSLITGIKRYPLAFLGLAYGDNQLFNYFLIYLINSNAFLIIF